MGYTDETETFLIWLQAQGLIQSFKSEWITEHDYKNDVDNIYFQVAIQYDKAKKFKLALNAYGYITNAKERIHITDFLLDLLFDCLEFLPKNKKNVVD